MNDLPARPVLWRSVPAGKVLAFAPHPDDEVAGPGGVLAKHRRQGDDVRVVITTDGTNGDPDGRYDRATYAERRRSESRAGLAELGIDDVQFYGFPDGFELSEADLEHGVELAAAAIRAFDPRTVYVPWERDGHTDHYALYIVVTRAIDRVGSTALVLGYEVWNAMIPDVIVDTTEVADCKRRAMRCHQSQLDYVDIEHTLLGLSAYRAQVHLRGSGYGEALQHIRGTLPPELADPDA